MVELIVCCGSVDVKVVLRDDETVMHTKASGRKSSHSQREREREKGRIKLQGLKQGKEERKKKPIPICRDRGLEQMDQR